MRRRSDPTRRRGSPHHDEPNLIVLAYQATGADFVEVLTMHWDVSGIVDAHTSPLVRNDRADGEAYRLPPEFDAKPTPIEEALDRTRAALWRHRRSHGRLPATVERFAAVVGYVERTTG